MVGSLNSNWASIGLGFLSRMLTISSARGSFATRCNFRGQSSMTNWARGADVSARDLVDLPSRKDATAGCAVWLFYRRLMTSYCFVAAIRTVKALSQRMRGTQVGKQIFKVKKRRRRVAVQTGPVVFSPHFPWEQSNRGAIHQSSVDVLPSCNITRNCARVS